MSVGSVVPFINDFLVLQGDPSTTVGGPFPEGRTKVTLLEFWATIPHLSELQRRYMDVDFTIISATWERGKSNEEKIRDFVQNNQSMDYTVVLDKNGTLIKTILEESEAKGEAKGIPSAFIIVNNVIESVGHPQNSAFTILMEEAAAKASKK
ncbi:hypothetical protein BGZ49_004567 [Haplosporangium sp. Z 27]|nr:hypothetical protein BGZ49_004567 [Haplosporangium sp. Z 27]